MQLQNGCKQTNKETFESAATLDQGVGAEARSRIPGAVHFFRSWRSHLNSGGAGAGATLLHDSSQL